MYFPFVKSQARTWAGSRTVSPSDSHWDGRGGEQGLVSMLYFYRYSDGGNGNPLMSKQLIA